MNPIVKEKWIEALKSDKYEQCTSRLYDGVGFCCLGVLTDVYIKETGNGCWTFDNVFCDGNPEEDVCYDEYLPPEVVKWAGLKSDNPKVGNSLSYFNDESRLDFHQIADLIERSL